MTCATHMNKYEREQAVAFYVEGVTVESLAVWFDRDHNTIGRLMKRAGVLRGNPDFKAHPDNGKIAAPRHSCAGVPKHKQGKPRPWLMETRL